MSTRAFSAVLIFLTISVTLLSAKAASVATNRWGVYSEHPITDGVYIIDTGTACLYVARDSNRFDARGIAIAALPKVDLLDKQCQK